MPTLDQPEPAHMPGLTCLRCGSTAVEVIRVIQVAENMHTADARCVACREQSILPLPPPVDD